jgi:2-polyprenyl-3-methyl-5-hydroxy-6-metoxy-1,4-benzoquinol methylase
MKKEWTGERLETGIHSQVTAEHLHRYALAMEYVQNKAVLDIACGEGYGSNLLAQKAASVVGVDIDKSTVNKAKNKYRKRNLSFLEGSASVVHHSIDVVVSFETLEHTSNHEQFLSEIKRVLQPGGLLIISTPDKKWYSDKTGYVNPFHEKELYLDEFEALLKKQFAHVNIVSQKFFSGSLVLSTVSNGSHDFYGGNFENVSKQKDAEALYMIAFASDSMLPPVASSFFNADDIMEAAILEKEKDIKNSVSYRLGNFLLGPAKWIKKLLKKA